MLLDSIGKWLVNGRLELILLVSTAQSTRYGGSVRKYTTCALLFYQKIAKGKDFFNFKVGRLAGKPVNGAPRAKKMTASQGCQKTNLLSPVRTSDRKRPSQSAAMRPGFCRGPSTARRERQRSCRRDVYVTPVFQSKNVTTFCIGCYLQGLRCLVSYRTKRLEKN